MERFEVGQDRRPRAFVETDQQHRASPAPGTKVAGPLAGMR